MLVHSILPLVVAFDIVESTVYFDQSELRNADDGVHENEQEEQKTERAHRWHSIDKCLEDDLKFLSSLDKSEDSADSERPEDGRCDSEVSSNAKPCNT